MTGRTLAEWDAEWSRRRINGLYSRRLNGSTLYSSTEREDTIRYYDLSEDDFDSVVATTGLGEVKLPDELRNLPRVVLGTDQAQEQISLHERRSTVSCPPLRAVRLYRLSQPCLTRIAAEPRPVQEPRLDY
jgi:hypothetical protein